MSFVQICIFVTFASIAPFYHNDMKLLIHLDAFFFAGMLSIFPCIFFYISVVTTKYHFTFMQALVHFVPAILFFFISFSNQFILTPEEQNIYVSDLPYIAEQHKALDFFMKSELTAKIFLIVQSILYLILISRLIHQYKERITNYFSNIKKSYFNWIHVFYITFAISMLASIPPLLLGDSYLIKDNHLMTISFFTLTVTFFAISYLADNHEYIEEDDFYVSDLNKNDDKSRTEFGARQQLLAQRIQEYFVSHKPYLNKDLKITDIAAELITNRTYISDAIRSVYNVNFNQFVNSYRIDEAISIFRNDTSDLSTKDVSEMVGFNSYNICVKNFKEKYNCTPSVYRRKLLEKQGDMIRP